MAVIAECKGTKSFKKFEITRPRTVAAAVVALAGGGGLTCGSFGTGFILFRWAVETVESTLPKLIGRESAGDSWVCTL